MGQAAEVMVHTGPVVIGYRRPEWVERAVIYEVFVRNFTPEGTFRAIIPRLSELKRLGVNVVWLMPIHPVSIERRKGALGSPYAIADFYSVDPAYGTEADFRALVEAVHALGMRILLDFVANHTGWDHPWTTAHPDWFTQDTHGGVSHPPGTDWFDVADLDYHNPAVRRAMTDVLRYWVEAFDVDGYRCDVAEMTPLDFWDAAIREVRSIKPVLMLAEGQHPDLHRHGFDLTYSWNVYRSLKHVWHGAPAKMLTHVLRVERKTYPEDALRLRFTTNHDETAWDAPPVQLFGSREGAMAAAVLALLLPGPPLLYNGQEVASDAMTPLFEAAPLTWDQHPEMRAFYQRLLALKNEHEALRAGRLRVLASTTDDVFVYARSGAGERFIVAVNVRPRPATVRLTTRYARARLVDVFTRREVHGPDLELAEFGFLVLRVT